MDHADLSGVRHTSAVEGKGEATKRQIAKQENQPVPDSLIRRFTDSSFRRFVASLKRLKLVRCVREPVKIHHKGKPLSQDITDQDADEQRLNASIEFTATDSPDEEMLRDVCQYSSRSPSCN